jgi:hypothetical protein
MGQGGGFRAATEFLLNCLDKRSATEVDGPASGDTTFTRSFNKPVTGTQYKPYYGLGYCFCPRFGSVLDPEVK